MLAVIVVVIRTEILLFEFIILFIFVRYLGGIGGFLLILSQSIKKNYYCRL